MPDGSLVVQHTSEIDDNLGVDLESRWTFNDEILPDGRLSAAQIHSYIYSPQFSVAGDPNNLDLLSTMTDNERRHLNHILLTHAAILDSHHGLMISDKEGILLRVNENTRPDLDHFPTRINPREGFIHRVQSDTGNTMWEWKQWLSIKNTATRISLSAKFPSIFFHHIDEQARDILLTQDNPHAHLSDMIHLSVSLEPPFCLDTPITPLPIQLTARHRKE
jgi:hypothetical protein